MFESELPCPPTLLPLLYLSRGLAVAYPRKESEEVTSIVAGEIQIRSKAELWDPGCGRNIMARVSLRVARIHVWGQQPSGEEWTSCFGGIWRSGSSCAPAPRPPDVFCLREGALSRVPFLPSPQQISVLLPPPGVMCHTQHKACRLHSTPRHFSDPASRCQRWEGNVITYSSGALGKSLPAPPPESQCPIYKTESSYPSQTWSSYQLSCRYCSTTPPPPPRGLQGEYHSPEAVGTQSLPYRCKLLSVLQCPHPKCFILKLEIPRNS